VFSVIILTYSVPWCWYQNFIKWTYFRVCFSSD